MTKSELCELCGNCCKSFIFEKRKPPTEKEELAILSWMNARGFIIIRENQALWRIRVPYACPHLKKHDNDLVSCDIYEIRPEACRKYDGRLERDKVGCLWITEKPDD